MRRHFLRIAAFVASAILTLSFARGKLVGSLAEVERATVESAVYVAVERAAGSYRNQKTAQARVKANENTLREQARKLAELGREKRGVRLRMGELRRRVGTIAARYNVVIASAEDAKILREQRITRALRRLQESASETCPAPKHSRHWYESLLQFILRQGGTFEHLPLCPAPFPVEEIEDLAAAEQAEAEFASLAKKISELHGEWFLLLKDYDQALAAVVSAEAQIRQNQRIMAEVHREVLRLQAELSRIDAKLREGALSALVEKGLMIPHEAAEREGLPGAPALSWPVRGRLSAGFLDAAYRKHFGVPHHGLDIAVPEGTPVGSAADGIVFLVRDGGASGYTYVLIGHRNGYATLYGHLLSTAVTAGDEVAAGQEIGRSGGRPGAPGSGPMTSGEHLHFEIIRDGVNINPRSVLP